MEPVPAPSMANEDMWKQLPIFMDELPDNPFEDPRTAALMDLMYDPDERPDQIALRFKERGNEFMVQHTKGTAELLKRQGEDEQGNRTVVLSKNPLQDAFNAYTQGIEAEPTDKDLLSTLYCNRAYASLLKGNNGKAYNDSYQALKHNKDNIKAYFRGAQALLNVGKAKEALAMCSLGLKVSPTSTSILKVQTEAQSLYAAQQKRLQERYKQQVKEKALERALEKRKIRYHEDEWLFESMQQYPRKMFYERENDLLHFSILVLYDEHNQSDFLEDAPEDSTIREILEQVFDPSLPPAPWDPNHQYTPKNVSVYIDDAESIRQQEKQSLSVKGYVKCSIDSKLLTILSSPQVEIFGLPAIHIVLKGSKFEKEHYLGASATITATI
eukprot:c8825_g1_i1.p1 GENE.c8825_g1_i1~~c8825_g1_i1.p1  ORF type:complete len:399 (+),score=116.44 c8825_g1_i1:47-1198(+)